jgi:hypothetical protein
MEEAQAQPLPGAAGDAAHLLVVDDDARLRALLQRFLAEQGFRVSTAPDAAAARSVSAWSPLPSTAATSSPPATRATTSRATSAARARASGRWGMTDLHRTGVVGPCDRARGQGCNGCY